MVNNKNNWKARQTKRKEEKRRKNRLQQRKNLARANDSRLEVRLARQTPCAWREEMQEDVALFDSGVLAGLPAELAAEANLVRQVLCDACAGKSGLGMDALAGIPRRSPFAQWRIFIRGFEAWKQGDLDQAKASWERLDRSRRAWRIAASLLTAHRDDLTEIRHQGLAKFCAELAVSDPWLTGSDDQLLLHAKLVRQTQIERVALRDAKQVIQLDTSKVPDATVNPEHIMWLREFSDAYQNIEPDLVFALQQTAVARAFAGPYIDMYRGCAKIFAGPPHDPKHHLMSAFFEMGDESQQHVCDQFNHYLQNDLQCNQSIPESLKAAIASEIYCKMAAINLQSKVKYRSPFDFSRPELDYRTAEEYLHQAIDVFPANRSAYEGLEVMFQEQLSNNRLLKSDRDELQQKLASVQQQRLDHLPNDIETRLELVDYLLEAERSADAKEHIQWLSGSPRDNPLADAMSWKWNLLEAMRMSRRKTTLDSAANFLDAAQQEWPHWLSQNWLPYLRAAVGMRGGDLQAFEKMSTADRVNGKLTDTCMRLGAAQRMSVESAKLKPIRQELDHWLASLPTIPFDDLMSTAGYFWDLHRTRLKYAAYRMHATKLLKQLSNAFDTFPQLVTERIEEPSVRAALLIMANEGLFNRGCEARFPAWMKEEPIASMSIVQAVFVSVILRESHTWSLNKISSMGDPLRQAAKTTIDSYERFLFESLANQLDEKLTEKNSSRPNSMSGVLDRIMEMIQNGVGNDVEDEDDDF